MKLIDSLAAEFEREANTTRRHLESLTSDKMDWRPHKKSFAAGGLASHIVECLGFTEPIFNQEEFDFDPATFKPYQASSTSELLQTFDEHVAKSKAVLAEADDEKLDQPWRLKINGKVWFEKPRASVFRDFVLSHVIHHRGQFSVYLRLLEIPVPGSYGPSADEQPPAM